MERSSRRHFLALIGGVALTGLSLAACGGSATVASSGSATTSAGSATSSAASAASTASATSSVTSAVSSAAAASTTTASTAASSAVATQTAPAGPTPTATPLAVTVKGTKVTFWHTQSGPNAKLLNSMILAYNAGQDKYTIAPEYKGSYNDIYKANVAAVNAGQPVPLSVAYENDVADYYSSDPNIIVAWDEYMNNTQYGLTAADKADFFPAFLQLGKFPQYGNKFLTFPFTKSMELMWYNADILNKAGFAKPPATWDEFSQQAQKISANGSPAWEFTSDASRFATWVFSRHGNLISSDGTKYTLDTPEAEDSMNLVASLVKAKAVAAPGGYQAETDFEQQKTAFYQDSSSARSYLLSTLQKANVNFNWTAEMPPVGQAGQEPASNLYGGDVCLFKTSSDEQLGAWDFMKYFSATAQTAQWALGTGYMPLRASAAATPGYKAFLAENPRNGVAISGLKYTGNQVEPKVASWEQVRDILLAMLQGVIAGTTTVKDGLATAQQKAVSAMQQS